MSGFAFAAFSVAHVLLGEENVFRSGTFDATNQWGVVSAVLGAIAATLGGLVCGCAARRSGPIWVLGGIVVCIGVMHALAGLHWEAGQRTGHQDLLEAQLKSRDPAWLLIALPLIDAIGITAGGLLGLAAADRPVAGRGGTARP